MSLVDVGKKYYSSSEANRTLKAKSVKVCEEKLGVVIVVGWCNLNFVVSLMCKQQTVIKVCVLLLALQAPCPLQQQHLKPQYIGFSSLSNSPHAIISAQLDNIYQTNPAVLIKIWHNILGFNTTRRYKVPIHKTLINIKNIISTKQRYSVCKLIWM